MTAFSVVTFLVDTSIESSSSMEKVKSSQAMKAPAEIMVPLSMTIPEVVSPSLICHPPRSQSWLPELCSSNHSSEE